MVLVQDGILMKAIRLLPLDSDEIVLHALGIIETMVHNFSRYRVHVVRQNHFDLIISAIQRSRDNEQIATKGLEIISCVLGHPSPQFEVAKKPLYFLCD